MVVMRLPTLWRCRYLTSRNLIYVVSLAQIVVLARSLDVRRFAEPQGCLLPATGPARPAPGAPPTVLGYLPFAIQPIQRAFVAIAPEVREAAL